MYPSMSEDNQNLDNNINTEGINDNEEEIKRKTIDKTSLVPEECFIEETNPDNSKKGIKSHITTLHVNQPIKRSSNKDESKLQEETKKVWHYDDLEDEVFETVRESTFHLDVTSNVEEFCDNLLDGDNSIDIDDKEVDKVMAEMDGKSDRNSEGNLIDFGNDAMDDESSSQLPPNQEQYLEERESANIDLLRGKVLSYEIEINKYNIQLFDKDNELNAKQT